MAYFKPCMILWAILPQGSALPVFLCHFGLDFLQIGHEHRDGALHRHHLYAVEHGFSVSEALFDVGVLGLDFISLPSPVFELLRLGVLEQSDLRR